MGRAAPKPTKINRGIYQIVAKIGNMVRIYEIEKFPDGSWILFWEHGVGRDYINDFATKRDAVMYVHGMVETMGVLIGGLTAQRL